MSDEDNGHASRIAEQLAMYDEDNGDDSDDKASSEDDSSE